MSRFLCLMYHNVVPREALEAADSPFSRLSPSITSYFVTSDQFREQVRLVPNNRWFDPRELRDSHACDGPSPDSPPRILLTFDDGWAGSFDEAGPILKAAGARAIVFVTTGLIGRPLFVDEPSLMRLDAGVFEIGSHTVTHPFLNELGGDDIRRELRDSKSRLEDILGRAVESVSIPNGAVDERVREAALRAGYRFVFTSETPRRGRPGDPANIGRVAVRRRTSAAQFEHWISGDVASAGWRAAALSVSRKILGPAAYRKLRAWRLGEKAGQGDMAGLLAGADAGGAS